MEQIHHITENLKKLKLPGMMNNLELRAGQARDSDLGYVEFFSLLIQDEIANRESNNFSKKIRTAGFGTEKTFEGFDFKFNNDVMPSSLVRDLASCSFIEKKQNLVISGPPGIGKTHIVKAIGHEMCRRGSDVFFTKIHELLKKLTAFSIVAERTMKKCLTVNVLILDDFAFRKMDQKESEIFYAITDERLGKLPILLTSNRPMQDWFTCFPDPVIGGAILDRLVSGAIKININKGKSFRKENGLSIEKLLDSYTEN